MIVVTARIGRETGHDAVIAFTMHDVEAGITEKTRRGVRMTERMRAFEAASNSAIIGSHHPPQPRTT